jgi:hypothetical protein
MHVFFKNPFEEIKKLAYYLEVELTDEQIHAIASFTSFKSMKSYLKFGDLAPVIFKNEMDFFRKGQVGDWVNFFSEEQSRRMDEAVAQKLSYKGVIKY